MPQMSPRSPQELAYPIRIVYTGPKPLTTKWQAADAANEPEDPPRASEISACKPDYVEPYRSKLLRSRNLEAQCLQSPGGQEGMQPMSGACLQEAPRPPPFNDASTNWMPWADENDDNQACKLIGCIDFLSHPWLSLGPTNTLR